MTSILITQQQKELLSSYILKEDKKQQKYINQIKQEVNKYISEYCSPYIKDYLDTPIVKFRPFDGYNQQGGPVSHLYKSIANNRSGSFFVWDKNLNDWVNLGGPRGKENPTEKKDKSGNVIATYNYEYKITNTFSNEEELRSSLPNGGEEGQGYLVNAQNKVIDFLRMNAFDQFSVTWNSGPLKYLPGAVRIACKDLGYYSFSQYEMKGGDICLLTKYINLIYRIPETMLPDGLKLDENLNGMDFSEFINVFKPNYQKYVREEFQKLDHESVQLESGGYEIFPIEDRNVGTMFVPTTKGREDLDKLSKYTDWCICKDMGEYAQYTQNGGKVYVCAKKGFDKIKEPVTDDENYYALDEYGLSLICVIVGRDGLPDNITTRYNHKFNGENHPDLWQATQLQRILGVRYSSVFIPRSEDELASAQMNESKKKKKSKNIKKVNAGIMDAITGCGMYENTDVDSPVVYAAKEAGTGGYWHIQESKTSDELKTKKLKSRMLEIAKFMDKNGLNVKPLPKLELKWEEQDGLFVPTGYYNPEEKMVTIFCNGRHPKDILRSFAHEMIHHSQNLNGIDLNFTTGDDVKDNKKLEKIESEAYLKGNILFRKWTEYEKSNDGVINESVLHDNIIPELESDDVDLSSFNIKHNLNPKFWKDGKLDSRVRMKLLDIADDFIETLGIPWVETKDIIITGSIANYNWNDKYSDIDLHVLVDYNDVDKRHDFVEKYFKAQKDIWNSEHENLTICGFPVEVYVQDINEEHTSTGAYSLENNDWIEAPDRDKMASSKVNKEYIKDKVAKYATKIDKLYSYYKKNNSNIDKLKVIRDKASKLFDKIKLERKNGLNGKDTEITNGNIIFKCLRRMDYIKKLLDIKSESYDEINSLNENTTVISDSQRRDISSRLNEIKVRDKWSLETRKNKTDLNYATYAEICSLDPTSKGDGNDMVAGKYCNWLLDKLDVSKMSDRAYMNSVRIALEQFNDGMRRGILQRSGIDSDINKFKSTDELISTMRVVIGGGEQVSLSMSNHMKALKGKYKIVAESHRWMVIAPMTWEAERYFGSGTEWCTVGSEGYFNDYMDDGQLYITVPKSMDKKLKMQFHFESESFADFEDNVVSNPKYCIYSILGDTDDLQEVLDMWDTVDDRFSAFKLVRFSDVERLLASGEDPKDVFDYCGDFRDGYAWVGLNGKWNFIDNDGRILYQNQWFDSCGCFNEGYAAVELNGKCNFIDKDGELLFPNQWLDGCGDFHEGHAQVELNEKCNFIDKDGELLFPNQWLDGCGRFSEGCAWVELNEKCNFIDKDGELLFPNQWFDKCHNFYEGYAIVELNGKRNFIDKDGELLFPNQWLDECCGFIDGYSVVELNGEWYYADTDGNLYNEKPTNSLNENKNSDFNVYVMCGCAGSGKSTWIKNNLQGIPVVSRDVIRAELGYCSEGEKYVGTSQQENNVTEVENKLIEKLCDAKVDFVVDNMNIKPKYRKKLISKLRQYNAKIIMVVMDTNIDACKQARNGQIPDDVMDKMHKTMSFPNDDEYDEIITVKR